MFAGGCPPSSASQVLLWEREARGGRGETVRAAFGPGSSALPLMSTRQAFLVGSHLRALAPQWPPRWSFASKASARRCSAAVTFCAVSDVWQAVQVDRVLALLLLMIIDHGAADDCGATPMEWLSNLLITKEALALLITVVSATVFVIAWRAFA